MPVARFYTFKMVFLPCCAVPLPVSMRYQLKYRPGRVRHCAAVYRHTADTRLLLILWTLALAAGNAILFLHGYKLWLIVAFSVLSVPLVFLVRIAFWVYKCRREAKINSPARRKCMSVRNYIRAFFERPPDVPALDDIEDSEEHDIEVDSAIDPAEDEIEDSEEHDIEVDSAIDPAEDEIDTSEDPAENQIDTVEDPGRNGLKLVEDPV